MDKKGLEHDHSDSPFPNPGSYSTGDLYAGMNARGVRRRDLRSHHSVQSGFPGIRGCLVEILRRPRFYSARCPPGSVQPDYRGAACFPGGAACCCKIPSGAERGGFVTANTESAWAVDCAKRLNGVGPQRENSSQRASD